ncbi:MAG: biphenyl 2,3-dioxygenase [Chloroflexi bacterium HGW-Chloroflexi-8]|jgi:3-phenylpropionate/trans-cinnamate dioxygenase ferredoxin subunit|nr:MAG: biphenyl 2,3-dioxygenase [Chloroflexi bacterium HGW-Chloroflexi-8]
MEIDSKKYTFYRILPVEELAAGERIFIEIENEPVVIFKVGEQIYAIGDRCTHDDGPLGDGELEDHQITCPRHGAKFDIVSGKALTLPAVEPTIVYPVRIINGQIEIGVLNN